jgi:hypothetical protein
VSEPESPTPRSQNIQELREKIAAAEVMAAHTDDVLTKASEKLERTNADSAEKVATAVAKVYEAQAAAEEAGVVIPAAGSQFYQVAAHVKQGHEKGEEDAKDQLYGMPANEKKHCRGDDWNKLLTWKQRLSFAQNPPPSPE